MVHSNTEALTDYWRRTKGQAPAPARTAVDPGAFTALLPQVFILGRRSPGIYPFRLVGGFVADLHGGDLRQASFLSLWLAGDRLGLQTAMERVRLRPEPLVARCDAAPAVGASISMEVLLAPLTGADGAVDRYLGLYQPTGAVARLMGRPVRSLHLRAVTAARLDDAEADPSEDMSQPRLRLAALDGRRIA